MLKARLRSSKGTAISCTRRRRHGEQTRERGVKLPPKSRWTGCPWLVYGGFMRSLGGWAVIWVAGELVLGCSSDSGTAPHGPEHGILDVDPDTIPIGENHGGSGGRAGSPPQAGSAGTSGGSGPASTVNPTIGKPCEVSSDCAPGLSCRFDTDYIAHKQCTTSCDVEATCLAVEPNSFCIGANVCVHACQSSADCPAKTLCNDNGWCERTGPGSGVPYCGGFATPCELLVDDLQCIAALGCSDDSSCSGVAQSCYSQFDSFSCSSQDGCNWSSVLESCSGSAHSCSSYSFDFQCDSQAGCYFTPGCAGVARSCSEIPVALCSNQPGCSQQTD